jgi:PAS domain S-box-containing protein
MMIHADDQARVLEQVERALAGHDVPPIEHRIITRDGRTRWIRDTIVLHRDQHGRVDRYDGLVEDISERKEAEGLFRQLLESAPDGIVIVDAGGTIVMVNARTEQLFGYERDELMGRPVQMLVPKRFRGRHAGHCARYAVNPCSRQMGAGREIFGVRKDGSHFPASITLSSLKTGDTTLLVSAIRDITIERQLEASQVAAEARLVAAQKIQERLLPTDCPRMPGIGWSARANLSPATTSTILTRTTDRW